MTQLNNSVSLFLSIRWFFGFLKSAVSHGIHRRHLHSGSLLCDSQLEIMMQSLFINQQELLHSTADRQVSQTEELDVECAVEFTENSIVTAERLILAIGFL